MLRRPRGNAVKVPDAAEDALRRKVLHHLYGSQTIPAGNAVTTAVYNSPATPYNGLEVLSFTACNQLYTEVGGALALRVYGYHYVSTLGAGSTKLAITHEGHSYFDLPNHRYHIQELLDAGWDVVAVQMPQVFVNAHPPNAPDPYGAGMINHPVWADPYEAGGDTGYVRTFLEPTFTFKAYLVGLHGYTTVVMMGISGGGWTTNMCAALDNSIAASWCIAGSMPWEMRNHVSRGDWEQLARSGYTSTFQTPTVARPFYALLPEEYHDLYAMGATGSRFTRQVYIEGDESGSFQPDGRHAQIDHYIQRCNDRVTGTVAVAYDTSQSVHCISNFTGDLIISDLAALGL